MTDLMILGTDTDAGKSTFAALWLGRFHDAYAYWKPVETGPSDTDNLRGLVPKATVHPPAQRFAEPVAPPLAARNEGGAVWLAEKIAAARPSSANRALLIETFGSPFSPLNDDELQIDLIRRLDAPTILVSSSKLGAVGRTIQTLEALAAHGVAPISMVLVGPVDAFAEATLRRQRPGTPVFSITPPTTWTSAGVQEAVARQTGVFDELSKQVGRASPPEWDDLIERDRRAVWHPYTPLRTESPPLAIIGAQDEFLHLADGRRLIDGTSSWWTIQHGHRPAFLMQALAEASRRIDHVMFAGATHIWAVELAELLLASVQLEGGRVFYSDNGSTAVEVALKMAYQYWRHVGESRRTRFVGFEHSYHGDTFGAMAVSRDPVFFGAFEPLLCQADIVPLDPAALDDHLRQRAHETAAVIVEPLVQGAGGMRMHSPETLGQLAEITRRHNVLLIADEVMTGGGRTGGLWAHQSASIKPDLICAAKTLAGGVLPLAATLVAPHIVAAFDTADRSKTFFHGHSFTAHPLACAVAFANWKRLTTVPLTAAFDLELFWTEALAGLRTQAGVKDLRICGSIAAVEVDVSGGYLADVGARMRSVCLDHDVLLRPLGSVLYAMPPLATSAESLRRIATAMIAAVEAL